MRKQRNGAGDAGWQVGIPTSEPPRLGRNRESDGVVELCGAMKAASSVMVEVVAVEGWRNWCLMSADRCEDHSHICLARCHSYQYQNLYSNCH
jgi:hypothetical protein